MIEVELCYNDFNNSGIRICSHFFLFLVLKILFSNYNLFLLLTGKWYLFIYKLTRVILKRCYITQDNYSQTSKKKYPFHQFSRIITYKYYFCPFFTYVDICLGVSSRHLCDIQSLNHILLTTSSEAKGVIDQHPHLQVYSHLLDYLCFQTNV